jgi:transcriptional regulator GlxA family with amidase domain
MNELMKIIRYNELKRIENAKHSNEELELLIELLQDQIEKKKNSIELARMNNMNILPLQTELDLKMKEAVEVERELRKRETAS